MQAWSRREARSWKKIWTTMSETLLRSRWPSGGKTRRWQRWKKSSKKGSRHQREEINVKAIRAKEETIPKPGGCRRKFEQPIKKGLTAGGSCGLAFGSKSWGEPTCPPALLFSKNLDLLGVGRDHMDDIVPDRIQNDIAYGMQIQLAHDIGAMGFCSFYA